MTASIAIHLLAAVLGPAGTTSRATSQAASAPLAVRPLPGAERLGETWTFEVAAPPGAGDPYDPNAAALDAEFTTPSGRKLAVPGFFIVPHRQAVTPAPRRIVRTFRIGMDLRNVPVGTVVEILVDDIRLVQRQTGKTLIVDDFEGELRWRSQHPNVTVAAACLPAGGRQVPARQPATARLVAVPGGEAAASPPGGGKALCVKWTAAEPKGWPAIALDCRDSDWETFDRIQMRVMPLKGRDEVKKRPDIAPMYQLHIAPDTWLTEKIHTGGFEEGAWRQIDQPLPRLFPKVEFLHHAADGPGAWQVRLTPLEAGRHRARFTFRSRDRSTRRAEMEFAVAAGEPAAFIRISGDDGRYLELSRTEMGTGTVLPRTWRPWGACDAGGPGEPRPPTGGKTEPGPISYFPIGVNLVHWQRDLGYYGYYLDRLGEAGGNFVRTWLSPGCLGFEVKAGRYDQSRAAAFEAFLGDCRRRGIGVMVCLGDFREMAKKHGNWGDSVYNAANGGPCKKPDEFFTSPAAGDLFRRRARYAVARWGAWPNIVAWEILNEADLTEGWKKDRHAVRQWHAGLAGYLRRLDAYGRPVTTSFSSQQRDELWLTGAMDLCQRHLYLDPRESFAAEAAAAVELLRPCNKPIFIGEFGRSGNLYAQEDAEGVSLHNALWASAASGSCGAAAAWYWSWIDENGLWPHLERLARFVEGIDWPAERLLPIQADLAAETAPAALDVPVRIVPVKEAWEPDPVNRPVLVAVAPDGAVRPAGILSGVLHGSMKAKEGMLNPVTFRVAYARAGRFVLHVDEVARAGAELVITLDGQVVLRKPFEDLRTPDQRKEDEDKQKQKEREREREREKNHAAAGAGPAGAKKAPDGQSGRKDDEDEKERPPVPARRETFPLDVPGGRHEIEVRNAGKDWIRVAVYELVGTRTTAPLRLMGLSGRRTAIVWLWNESHTWDAPVLSTPVVEVKNITAVLRDLPPGRWRVRPFDPWTGRWQAESAAVVADDGLLRLTLPALRRDFAWRLEKLAVTP